MENKVYIKGCQQYEVDTLVGIIKEGIEAVSGQTPLIKEGSTVFIKTNLLIKRRPEEATTTHPAVVEAAARVVKSYGAKAVIGDSPAGQFTPAILKSIYDVCGIAKAAENSGATLNYNTDYTVVSWENNGVSRQFEVINAVLEADVVISLCKLKTHGMVTFTGAVKNMFGVIPGLIKAEYHFKYPSKLLFCKMLVDLCECVKPQLSIMDGIVGMEGDGPSGGTPRKIGVMLVSQNPHACDMVAAHMIGLKKEEVFTLLEGVGRGLCKERIDELELLGDDVRKFEIKDFIYPRSKVITFVGLLPEFLRKPLFDVLTPKPQVNREKCIGCKECYKDCPAKTIAMIDGKAQINKSGCIKCYCCHEVCPVKAIDIKKGLLGRLSK